MGIRLQTHGSLIQTVWTLSEAKGSVKLPKYWKLKPMVTMDPKWENCKHRCLVTGTLTSDSGRTTFLHKGHSNLAQKTLLYGCLPSNCLLNLGPMPPLLLILLTQGNCFKTTYVSLPFCFRSLCIPNCTHCFLWHIAPWSDDSPGNSLFWVTLFICYFRLTIATEAFLL